MLYNLAKNELQREILESIWTVGCKIAMKDLEKDEIFEVLNKWSSEVNNKEYTDAIINLNEQANNGILVNPDHLLLRLLPIIKDVEDNRKYEYDECCECCEYYEEEENIDDELERLRKENEVLRSFLLR